MELDNLKTYLQAVTSSGVKWPESDMAHRIGSEGPSCSRLPRLTPTIGDSTPVPVLEAHLDLPSEALTTGHPPSRGGKGKEPLNQVPTLHEGPSSPIGTEDSGKPDDTVSEEQCGGVTGAPCLQESP
ncbi:hypothetical protein Taro_001397 [Colocasia esculenta]|uniref:Uncharacterized protein n=1 Tax=Colocasia esculenta TaxID=4460 RepID=A0A843TIX6_COLES|nr:hypothetical protein [Colocasia esculenta]